MCRLETSTSYFNNWRLIAANMISVGSFVACTCIASSAELLLPHGMRRQQQHLLFFVGHVCQPCFHKINEVRQHISRRLVVRRGRNLALAALLVRPLLYIVGEFWPRGSTRGTKILRAAKYLWRLSYTSFGRVPWNLVQWGALMRSRS